MNAAKLKQAIIKEVSRSPGKTMVLVAMLPVAAYFCFPLVKRYLPTRSAEGAATSTVANSTPSFLLPAATAPAPVEQALPDWRQVLNWIATDQLAAPSSLALSARSPFQLPEPPAAESSTAKTEAESDSQTENSGEVEQASGIVTLRDLDLKLTATIVSGSTRLATINGRVVNEGETFRAKSQADESSHGAGLEVTVVKIERRAVLLRHGNETIELKLPPELPEDAVLVRTIRN